MNFRHNGSFARTTRFKEFDDTRQTADDVFRLGRFTRNLRDDVARFDFLLVFDVQVGANRHLVSFQNLVAVANFKTRLTFLVRVFTRGVLTETLSILLERLAFFQV